MNIVKRFIKSLYDFDEYNNMIKYGFVKAVLNVFIVSAIIIIMLISAFIIDYVRLGGITGMINRYVPEFSIENGVLQTDKYYRKELDTYFIGILDTKSAYTEDDLLKYEAGAIIVKDRIILKSFTGDIVQCEYDFFEKLGITNKESVLNFVPFIKICMVIFVLMLLGFVSIANVFYAFIFSVAIYFICYKYKINITIGDSFKISCYAISTPLIFNNLMSSLDRLIKIQYSFTMPTFMNVGVVIAFCYFAVKAVMEDRKREEKEKKEREAALAVAASSEG